MHIGRGDIASKTEAVFFPGPRETQADGDISGFEVADGFVSFTDEFKYLGSLIHNSLTANADVDQRITKATAAFGALRKCFFSNKHITPKDKGIVYTALCLSVLLYGSECWCLTEKLFDKLRGFHHRCVRAMCHVNMHTVIKFRLPTANLLYRLNIKSLDYYYNTRLLRWAGHVARMPMNRLPRKLLTGWVNHKRPRGGVQMTFGRTLNKALLSAKIPVSFDKWHAHAQDRVDWRRRIGLSKANSKKNYNTKITPNSVNYNNTKIPSNSVTKIMPKIPHLFPHYDYHY